MDNNLNNNPSPNDKGKVIKAIIAFVLLGAMGVVGAYLYKNKDGNLMGVLNTPSISSSVDSKPKSDIIPGVTDNNNNNSKKDIVNSSWTLNVSWSGAELNTGSGVQSSSDISSTGIINTNTSTGQIEQKPNDIIHTTINDAKDAVSNAQQQDASLQNELNNFINTSTSSSSTTPPTSSSVSQPVSQQDAALQNELNNFINKSK